MARSVHKACVRLWCNTMPSVKRPPSLERRKTATAAVWWARALLVALLPAGSLAAGSLGGCGSDPNAIPTGPSGAGGGEVGTGGEGGLPEGVTGAELFAALEPDLMDECGACHQLQGSADAPFLAAPDTYVSITSWPGVVVEDVESSLLLTHPGDPLHGGGEAPDLTEELRERVRVWLGVESKNLPDVAAEIITVTPFKPLLGGAFNTVYLNELGEEFANVSITFNAEQFGDPPSLLVLENLKVHPLTAMTLYMRHPLFSVYAEGSGADPDPGDSFSTFEHDFSVDTDSTLGTGTLILTNWQPDAFLGIAFEAIEVLSGGGAFIPCDDIESFKANVVPAMQVCASQCHGGEDADAQETMDLSELNAETPSDACGQVRARITPGDPDTSQIVVVTNPAEPAVHKFKFMGAPSAHAAFKTAVTPWILAE